MVNYFIFETQEEAKKAADYIKDKAGYPWTNKINGINNVDKCKTERWADPVETKNRTWVFPALNPNNDKHPVGARVYYNELINQFNFKIEKYSVNWF